MSKELTKEQGGAIIYCRQRGDSYRTIATTVGCGVSMGHSQEKHS